MKIRPAAVKLALAITLAHFAAGPLIAQSAANTGLAGSVIDPSGASIPETKVTLTHLETGDRRVAKTDDAGEWEVRFLAAGRYRIIAEHPRFKTLVRHGITVTTAQIASINVALELGNVLEVIEVTADAGMAASNSATIVRTLDGTELQRLPTSSRNFTHLLAIEPGVSADLNEPLSNRIASISPSVNGARTTNNSLSLNGVDVTSLICCNGRLYDDRGTIDEGGGSLSRNVAPALESLAEVSLETSLYDASAGRNGGGRFQLVTRSGTNQFHGSLYDFLQNDSVTANDFFLNRDGVDRPAHRRNEGGFTLGGPIAANRTFFFGSYQLTRVQTSFVDQANNAVRMPASLTDDRTDEGILRFANSLGVKSPADINPISRSLLRARLDDGTYLVPSGAAGQDCRQQTRQVATSCRVTSVFPAGFDQDQFSIGVDHQLTQSHRLNGRFFFANQESADPLSSSNALTPFEEDQVANQRTVSLTELYVPSSGIVNEFRAGYFRNRNDIAARPRFTNEQFGIHNPLAGVRPDLAEIRIQAQDVGDAFRFGTISEVTLDVQNTFTVADTLSVLKDNHSLRFGGEFRRSQLNGDRQEDQNIKYRFRTWSDFLTVGAKDSDGRARQVRQTIMNYGETVRGFRLADWAAFIADDWKLAPNLTLNLGLRYEYLSFPTEVNGLLSTVDKDGIVASGDLNQGFLFASNFDGASLPSSAPFTPRLGRGKSLLRADRNNVAPRFGFAWQPGRSRGLVIRGGYGIYYERMTGAFVNSLRRSAPFFREVELARVGDWNVFPADRPSVPFPAFLVGFDGGEPQLEAGGQPGAQFEAYETQVLDPRLSTPYAQHWNLTLAWEPRSDLLLSLGYVGSKGSKLLQILNGNQAIDVNAIGYLPRPGAPNGGFAGNYYDIVDGKFENVRRPPSGCNILDDPEECLVPAELRAPILGFDEDEGLNTLFSNANSIYHSLQISLDRRYRRDFMFNANYTFSRSIDTFSDEGLFQAQHDQNRPFLNRALSDFHRKHRFIISGTYDVPFRSHWLAKGWSLSGIGTFQSGRPFTVIDSELSGFLFASRGPRPNIAPGATHKQQMTEGPASSRIDGYLNRDAFVSSGPQFGDLGRNTIIGPGQMRVDAGVSKVSRFRERASLEFRVEVYNVSNTPTFRPPVRDLASGSFGQLYRTRGGPRVTQLGLKFTF